MIVASKKSLFILLMLSCLLYSQIWAAAPAISVQPGNTAVIEGKKAMFSVVATGTAPLSFQWQKNGLAIDGAIYNNYTTPVNTIADNGAVYNVVVTNPDGSLISNDAILTVNPNVDLPGIVSQPKNTTVNLGQKAFFNVVASGAAPLNYEWRKNGIIIKPADANNNYTTPYTKQSDDGAKFSVRVFNGSGGVFTNEAILTVYSESSLSITSQPQSTAVIVGQTATFTVTATGTAPLSYQWRKNGADIGAATSASYTTSATTLSDNGAVFSVVVSDGATSVTSSNAVLTVNNAALSITAQPQSIAVGVGQAATFTVTATGMAPLSYQWRKNGADIGAAISASYTTPPTTLSDNGAVFSVVVSDGATSVTSSNAVLTVNNGDIPKIVIQPKDTAVVLGRKAMFSMKASGMAPLSFEWRKNGVAVRPADGNNNYTTPYTKLSDDGAKFSVRVFNGFGETFTAEAILTVISKVVITKQPQNTNVIVGQTATFSVEATGTGPISYQWLRDGLAISGATLPDHVIPVTTLSDNEAIFSVTVSNSYGDETSSNATLTVTDGGPIITTQPQNTIAAAGQTATFTVVANGLEPLGYQWSKNGTVIAGATSARYTTPVTVLVDSGAIFNVLVTNEVRSVSSDNATLTVNPAIIIDHNCTDLSKIPEAWFTTSKQKLKIGYGHASHGRHIIIGMDAMKNSTTYPLDYTYSWRYNPDTFMNDGAFPPAATLGDPDRTEWAQATRNLLEQPGGCNRNVVVWSWCGEVNTATSADIQNYLSLMTQLETDFPNVQFVYMTGHLVGTGTNGNLNLRNEQIRNYCKTNNKVLFDFADLESFDPDGHTNYMTLNGDDFSQYSGGNWASEWINANPSHELTQLATTCGSCDHSQQLNCILEARAFWWLLARLAGWDGQPEN